MKYSLMLTTVRSIEYIKPMFKESSPDAEIIIIDPKYNEKTKQELEKLEHNYCQIIYAPKFESEEKKDDFSIFKYKNDKMRCQNTGLAFCEGDWIYKLDDSTEFCPNFFDILDENIKLHSSAIGNNNFVVRPVKLESWMGHKKWQGLPSLETQKGRFFEITRNSYFETLDQFIATRESFYKINGMDERYDCGHGHDDLDILQRYLTLGNKIILDRELKTYQIGHKRTIDPIPVPKWLFEMEIIEIMYGRYFAYNPHKLNDLRSKLLPDKEKYKIKKKGSYVKNTKYRSGDYPFNKFFTSEELATNMDKIFELKDKHKGEDLFILGNSPDITKNFIDKIRDKITFAANGFLVMKDIWNYEPTYMVVSNQGTFDNHLRNMIPDFKQYEGGSVSDLFIKSKSTFILSDLVIKPVLFNFPCHRKQERIDFLKKHIHIKILNKSEFEPPYEIDHKIPDIEDINFDLSKGTYLCGTVITDLMLPLAIWMGFKNIYLKGCSGGAGHFYDTSPRHFWDEKYQKHMYQDMYAVFKQSLDKQGVNIYNLDKPTMADRDLDIVSKIKDNPTKADGHLWDGPILHYYLGKEPNIIPYKPIEDVL